MTEDKTSHDTPPRASVSVVIPTKGRPELLRRAVSSVLAQEYDGTIECIVVHDGEDPAPGEALTSGRRRVIPLRNDRTQGAAGARNCGFLQATGEYLALCDDDDLWLPGKLAAQVAQLARHPEAIGSGGGFLLRQGERTSVKTPRMTRVTHADLLRSRVADVHPSTLVFRRERLLQQAGLLDEQIPGSYGEDYDWLLRATHHGDVVTVQKPVAEILWHQGSFFSGQWRTISEAILYLLAKHPDLKTDPQGVARLYGRLAFAYAALGRREEARHYAVASIKAWPRQRRAYIALAAGSGALRPSVAMRIVNLAGKGL